MAFQPPAGTELVEALGTGTVFSVALVREGAATLMCKRLASRFLREPAGRAAILREAKVLALGSAPGAALARPRGERRPWALPPRDADGRHLP